MRLACLIVVLNLWPTSDFLKAHETDEVRHTTKSQSEFEQSVQSLFGEFCNTCHDDAASEGGFSLGTLDLRVDGRDYELWRMIDDRVRLAEMPPSDAQQPTSAQREKFLHSIRSELLRTQQPGHRLIKQQRHPRFGNYIDHDALFNQQPGPVIPGPPRLWRYRAPSDGKRLRGHTDVHDVALPSSPFVMRKGRGLKDYADLYFIDEPVTAQLLAKAQRSVREQSRAVLEMLIGGGSPSAQQVNGAIRTTFQQILFRDPTLEETARLADLHRKLFREHGAQLAAERLLMAIYLQPEALFREELGSGSPDNHGRLRLAGREIAMAISYALADSPDPLLLAAAEKGQLASRAQIAAHLQRRFAAANQQQTNPRIMQFFREYFGYGWATEVFKTQPKRGVHLPAMLVNDLDLLIEHLVGKDQQVLNRLLTTNEFFIDARRVPETGELVQATSKSDFQADRLQPDNPEHATIYGLPRDWIWVSQQPLPVPKHMRAGVLTHPAWLVAWSGNFDNHPVQRGSWIRTHLLGGTVPDVPIGVDATVTEDQGQQFRQRLVAATAADECQRCHKKMDSLGLPFEQYDHYGRFRLEELERPVDTSGGISHVKDSTLAGPVEDPIAMMHRLATSERVEQVFVRYVFRYFMGRNETLGDAKTLQEAHQAYRESDGSFRALVQSLLTSDSFLYRTVKYPVEYPDG